MYARGRRRRAGPDGSPPRGTCRGAPSRYRGDGPPGETLLGAGSSAAPWQVGGRGLTLEGSSLRHELEGTCHPPALSLTGGRPTVSSQWEVVCETFASGVSSSSTSIAHYLWSNTVTRDGATSNREPLPGNGSWLPRVGKAPVTRCRPFPAPRVRQATRRSGRNPKRRCLALTAPGAADGRHGPIAKAWCGVPPAWLRAPEPECICG